jgi:hypothetical protein
MSSGMDLESGVAAESLKVEKISKNRQDILRDIQELESHQEKINLLYHFTKHGDHETKEHAWDILEEMYDEHAVRDSVSDAEKLVALRKMKEY